MTKRIEWIDVAKGGSIILVVFSHTLTSLDTVQNPHDIYFIMNHWLRDIRMPLFMMVSGILAARVLQSNWHTVWHRRLLTLSWVYLIWTVLTALGYSLVDSVWTPILPQYYAPDTALWYIAGLIFNITLAWLIRAAPKLVQLGIAVCLYFAAERILETRLSELTFAYVQILRLFIVFLIGALYGRRICDLINRRYWLVLVGGLCGTVASMALNLEIGVTVFGVAAAFALSAVVAGYAPGLKRMISLCGAYSLGILCLHMQILHLLAQLPYLTGPLPHLTGPLLFTLAGVLGSIGFYSVLKNVPMLWGPPQTDNFSWLRKASPF